MTTFKYNEEVFAYVEPGSKEHALYFSKTSHRLTVIDVYTRVTEGKARQRYCLCTCSCGNIKLIHADGIRKQRTKSCGCWKSEVDAGKAKEMGDANLRHGLSKTRIYKSWDAMNQRCRNPKDADYPNYGGRGIQVDPRWHSFEAFYADMAEGYGDKLTIERLDVNGNYEKRNCVWVTMAEQQRNKRATPKKG